MMKLAALLTVAGCAAGAPLPPTLRTQYGLAPPESLRAAATALVLVDVQHEFVDGGLLLAEVSPAVARARELLAWARASGVLVVHIRQIARAPSSKLFARGSRGAEPLAGFEPLADEWVIEKPAGGAFTAPDLEPRLRASGIERLVVAGFMTHLAVAATATEGTTRGFAVIVAADATATRALPAADGGAPLAAPEVQRAALASLGDRAADVMGVGAVVALRVEK